jgi:hypothetical protein
MNYTDDDAMVLLLYIRIVVSLLSSAIDRNY